MEAERLKEERNSHQRINCKEQMMKRAPKLRQEIIIFSTSKAKILSLGAYDEYVYDRYMKPVLLKPSIVTSE
jgi:hypothetical protein